VRERQEGSETCRIDDVDGLDLPDRDREHDLDHECGFDVDRRRHHYDRRGMPEHRLDVGTEYGRGAGCLADKGLRVQLGMS
jgi:hypothetical protein